MKRFILINFVILTCFFFSACDSFDSCARIGHTTKLGVCSNCGEFNNEYRSILNDINENIIDSSIVLAEGAYSISTTSLDLYQCKVKIEYAKNYLNEAIFSCGDIQELSTLKQCLVGMKNALDNISGTSTITYLNNLKTQYKIYTDYLEKADAILSEWEINNILESVND